MSLGASIEPSAPAQVRRRFRAPPIRGRGVLKTFKLRLHEGGATKAFLVGAYNGPQAAGLLQVGEKYLKRNAEEVSEAERERAETIPGQVWVLEPGAPNYTKWLGQAGLIWS